MNGGRTKWDAGETPPREGMSLAMPTPPLPCERAGQSIRAFRDDVLDTASPEKPLVDVRSPKEYLRANCCTCPTTRRKAPPRRHIPGAVSIPWATGGQRSRRTFKIAEELRQLYSNRQYQRDRRYHRLLPHRRALLAYLVCAEVSAGLPEGQELRRLLDRMGQPGGRADPQGRTAMSDFDRAAQLEYILDHYQNPRNSGAMPDADVHLEGGNSGCSDVVTMYLKMDGDRIGRISFEGSGCTIARRLLRSCGNGWRKPGLAAQPGPGYLESYPAGVPQEAAPPGRFP